VWGALLLLGLAMVGCARSVETVASDLTNPRKIAFEADGTLLVAEAGTGVDDGRIVRVGRDRRASVLLDELPSFPYTPDEIVGPAAARPGPDGLYWIQGLGRDERRSGGLLRLREGQAELLASLRFAARSAPDGDTTISNPYDLLLDPDGTAFVSDASANVVWRVDPDRRVGVHLAWTALQDPVPTGLARGPDGAYYVALFSPEPHAAGSGQVVRFDRAGERAVAVAGLTMPIALAFEPDGAMLVLELASGFRSGERPAFPGCGGRLLRVVAGRHEVVAERLDRPTDVAVGPDGAAYLTIGGAFGRAGSGRVVRLARPGPLGRLSPSVRSGRCLS
jgi:sugar lactone lactonase YvrE